MALLANILHLSLQYGDTFLIIGGYYHSSYLGTIFEFDSENFAWIKRDEKLATPRGWHTVLPLPKETGACNNELKRD